MLQELESKTSQTFSSTLLNSEPDLDDLSEPFLHDLEGKYTHFQSVDSTSTKLSSHFESISSALFYVFFLFCFFYFFNLVLLDVTFQV